MRESSHSENFAHLMRDKELTDPEVRERIAELVEVSKVATGEAFASIEKEMGNMPRLSCLAMISETADKFKQTAIELAISMEDAKAAGNTYKQRASLEFDSADYLILAQLVAIGHQAVTAHTLQKVLDGGAA